MKWSLREFCVRVLLRLRAGRRDGIAHSDLLTIDERELRVGTVKIASGAGRLFTSPLPEAGSCTVPVKPLQYSACPGAGSGAFE
jgi:hypothetical protein